MPTNKKKGKKKAKSQRFRCLHGSAEENFHGDYEDAIGDLFHRIQTFQGDPNDREAVAGITKEFVADHTDLVFDTRFCSHLYSWCAREALKSELRLDLHFANVKTILSLAISLRYYYIAESNGEDVGATSKNGEKIAKYNREIYTRQGAIRRIAREVPCDCFAAYVEEAKAKGKVGMCFGCKEQFPLSDLNECTGCGAVDYCGRKCQKKHWPEHKEMCEKKKQQSKMNGHDTELEMLKIKMYMEAMGKSTAEQIKPAEDRKVMTNFLERKEPKLEKSTGLRLQSGDVVRIEGLIENEQFNGLRGIILNSTSDDIANMKYVVVIEGTAKSANCRGGKKHEQLMIESNNLRKYRQLPLPKGIERGRVIGNPPGNGWSPKARAWRLVENLVHETETYKPSEIVFMGEAASNFMSLPGYPDAYQSFSCTQIEQLGGLLALARMASIENHDAEVVFALLEADPMVVDVIIMLFTATPYIGEDAPIDSNAFHDVDPFNELTPSQSSLDYIDTIRIGHIRLFTTILYQEFYEAVTSVFRRSPLFHLLVRRLLSIISREVDGYSDGLELAKYCKGIMDILCGVRWENTQSDRFFLNPLPAHVGKEVLSKTARLKSFDELQPAIQNVFSKL